MPKHNKRYSCMEKPRVNQFCSQCYCMRLPCPQSWYPVLDELILGSYTEILFQDVPRASRVQPEMFYETSTLAFSNIVSHWKLEFWMFLRSYRPRLVFMSFNPYCTRFCRVSEILNGRSINAEGSNHKQRTFSKMNYTAVQLSIFFNFESECYQFILFQYDFLILYHPGENTTWQWKIQNLKMYFPLNMGIFQCHFGFPGCTH